MSKMNVEGKKSFKDKMKEKAKMVFKTVIPMVAAAYISVNAAQANVETGLSIGATSSKIGATQGSGMSINFGKSKGEGAYLEFMASRESRSNTQAGSIKPMDTKIMETENVMNASESIIRQSVALTLDKVENNIAYFTLYESNIDSIGGSGGTIGVNETQLQVKLGKLLPYASLKGVKAMDVPGYHNTGTPVTVPSSFTDGKVFHISAYRANASDSGITVSFSEWLVNSSVDGNISTNLIDNRKLGRLGTRGDIGRGWKGDAGMCLGLGDRTVSMNTLVGSYSATSNPSYYGIYASVQKEMYNGMMGANIATLGSIEDQYNLFNENSAGLFFTYKRIGIDATYKKSGLTQYICQGAVSNIESMSWSSEDMVVKIAANVCDLVGGAIKVGVLKESSKDTVEVSAMDLSVDGSEHKNLKSESESSAVGASVSMDTGSYGVELDATNSGVKFVIRYTW